jgi:hypothetical protein
MGPLAAVDQTRTFSVSHVHVRSQEKLSFGRLQSACVKCCNRMVRHEGLCQHIVEGH